MCCKARGIVYSAPIPGTNRRKGETQMKFLNETIKAPGVSGVVAMRSTVYAAMIDAGYDAKAADFGAFGPTSMRADSPETEGAAVTLRRIYSM